MAPNAHIINIPIESIERNQYEPNFGEGIETVPRRFNNFDHYLQTRRIDPFFINSSNYYADDEINNFQQGVPRVAGDMVSGLINRTNYQMQLSYVRQNIISIENLTLTDNNHLDDSYISLPDLIPCDDVLDTNTIQSSNVLNTFLTPTQANILLGIAGFYKRLFPQMLNNIYHFITNPYSFLKTETNLRILFEKLENKTKQSRKLFVKPKRSKHPIVKTSNKSSQCHSKKAQLQRKCKHSTR